MIASGGTWLYYYDYSSGDIIKMMEDDLSQKQVVAHLGIEEFGTFAVNWYTNTAKSDTRISSFYCLDGYLYFTTAKFDPQYQYYTNFTTYRIQNGSSIMESTEIKFHPGLHCEGDLVWDGHNSLYFIKDTSSVFDAPVSKLSEVGDFIYREAEIPDFVEPLCIVKDASKLDDVLQWGDYLWVVGQNLQGESRFWQITKDGESTINAYDTIFTTLSGNTDMKEYLLSSDPFIQLNNIRMNKNYFATLIKTEESDYAKICVATNDWKQITLLDMCNVYLNQDDILESHIAVSDEYIYYINENKNIARVTFDGTEKSILTLQEVDYLVGLYDWLYFRENNNWYRVSYDDFSIEYVANFY